MPDRPDADDLDEVREDLEDALERLYQTGAGVVNEGDVVVTNSGEVGADVTIYTHGAKRSVDTAFLKDNGFIEPFDAHLAEELGIEEGMVEDGVVTEYVISAARAMDVDGASLNAIEGGDERGKVHLHYSDER